MLPARRVRLIGTLALALLGAGSAQAQILTAEPPPLSRWDYPTVRQAATEIQDAAERARLAASEQTRPTRREHAVALTALTTLAGTAQHFSSQVDQFRLDPEPTRQDYLALVRSYNEAKPTVLKGEYDAKVMQDFARIGPLIDRLSLVYTQQWNRDLAKSAADALEGSLASADRTARGRATDNPADRRAAFLLQQLAQAAQFLNRELDHEQDPLISGEDFRAVEDDYALTVRSLQLASFREYLEADLKQAGHALGQLRRAYQVPWNGSNARAIMDQVRTSARHLLDSDTERANRGEGGDPRRAENLRLLVQVADRLGRELDVHPDLPLETYPGFLLLMAIYAQSSLDLSRASFDPQTIAELNSLGQQIAQLNRMYSWALAQGPAHLTGTVIGR